MDRRCVIADFPGFARVCQELWLKGVLSQDVLFTDDALLWSINDYPALGTMAGRRVTGYKACCHCYHEALSVTSNVEHVNHRMVRRLER